MQMRSFVPLLIGLVLAPVVVTNASTVQTRSLRGEDVDEQAGFLQDDTIWR